MVGGESSHAKAREKRSTSERAQETAQRIAEDTARTGLRIAGHTARTILRNVDDLLLP